MIISILNRSLHCIFLTIVLWHSLKLPHCLRCFLFTLWPSLVDLMIFSHSVHWFSDSLLWLLVQLSIGRMEISIIFIGLKNGTFKVSFFSSCLVSFPSYDLSYVYSDIYRSREPRNPTRSCHYRTDKQDNYQYYWAELYLPWSFLIFSTWRFRYFSINLG